MAYATDVRVKYCDGKEQRLNLMSIIWGRQASGKSSVKDVIDIWKRPMKEADAANRQAEDEFKKLRKNRALYDQLPDTFTFQMLQQAKPEAKYAALRMMCTLWKRNGLIRAVDVNQWQKC